MSHQKRKTRYPPAYYRYKQKCPTISICLSKPLKDAIDIRKGNMSYSEFVKRLIEGHVPEITMIRPIWYHCSICGKPIVIIPNSRSHKRIMEFMQRVGWGHAECHERAKQEQNRQKEPAKFQKSLIQSRLLQRRHLITKPQG